MEDWSDEEAILEAIEADDSAALSTSIEFPFPFEPYSIQKELMGKLYETLEGGKIGIFESPTGTGKSMSIICGTLKWLTDYERRREAEVKQLLADTERNELTRVRSATSSIISKSQPDWIRNYSKRREEREEIERVRREREVILKREKRLLDLKENLQATDRPSAKRKRRNGDMFDELMTGADVKVKEKYEKEVEQIDDDFLLNQAETELKDESDEDEVEVHVTKIYFCSRTHSQLSQFVGEVQKSPYCQELRSVALGSRQNMCVNPDVSRLKSLSLINDRCKELQKKKSSSTEKLTKEQGSCPYYNSSRMRKLTDLALSQVRDIEDLVEKGRKVKACPYYSARHAIAAAQLVVLPYNTLLHNSTRKASGIKLDGNVVVIDEAHNLLETISSIHSVEVFVPQFVQARSQLLRYRDKYRSRLLPLNLLHISQLIDVVEQFISLLSDQSGHAPSRLMTVNDFLSLTQLDNINFFVLLRFCHRSQIARKLSGFVQKVQTGSEVEKINEMACSAISSLLKKVKSESKPIPELMQDCNSSSTTDATHRDVAPINSPLYLIENLLQSLTNSDTDGRVIVNRPNNNIAGSDLKPSSIRYLLLNPAIYFSKIVEECRSVVIAGGTMQPISEFKQQLFQTGAIKPERIVEYSCGHVISDENVLPITLSHDSRGNVLDFTYQSRNAAATLRSLCQVLADICQFVPGGVVCFLPSYQYESVVMDHLHKSDGFETIDKLKKIFREPKKANMVESILDSYSRTIQSKGGAILFSVVGGKMSEGINFSDSLGRCVVMVGLPYPNKHSVELQEKLSYLNKTVAVGTGEVSPGQLHYENLCMKAINQSIGRAIRHKNDYACMLLLDHRYQRDSIISKLPTWLNKHVRKLKDLTSATAHLQQFFRSHHQ